MKRAIYVGKQKNYPWSNPDRHPLIYGMTGEYHVHGSFYSFRPDGCECGKMIERHEIYITAEDLTRYRPKPTP